MADLILPLILEDPGAAQTTFTGEANFPNHITIDGVTVDLSSGATLNQVIRFNGTSFVPATLTSSGVVGPRVIPAGFPLNSVLGTPSIAGAINFNPGDYSGVTTIKFRAIAANGNTTVSTSVKLRDVTNSVDIVIFTFTGSTATADSMQEQVLTVSAAGTNTIANNAVFYEVSIYVNSPTTGGTNYIQLFSAELRVS